MSPSRRNQRPADPQVAAIVEAAQSTAFTRRNLMRWGIGAGVVGAAGLGTAGCAPPKPPAGGINSLKLPKDLSAEQKIVNWANWTAYLDFDEKTKSYPTLNEFYKRTGIKVSYSEDIEDNDAYYAKIAPQLRAGQSIDRDLFVFTDWMAARVIRDRLCQPMQLINMPNVAKNMLDPLRMVSFDPGRNESITWQSGFAGIGYNRKKVGREIKSLDDLWTDDLKGKITVLSEFRDTIGIVMQSQGVDITSDWGKSEFEKAVAFVEEKIKQGYIRKVKGNSYMEDLTSGNAWAGITWSGDIFILAADTKDPNWEFVIPESGGTLWSDNFMVPITSQHRANATKMMDFYYEPAIAAQVAAYVNYVCPVKGAQAEMEKIDPELAASWLIFPTAEFIKEKNIQGFRVLTPDEDTEYSDMWSKRVMGN
ncbi:MAG: spermidine/putrescine ABC transporter substrate-binding protein [Nocardioidaceae bacterium]|jgi:spermidine/putrescine transport system substrate-binding protein|nr:spermidine/putrescine ABC transporter substrate-binding protein [Nocardioidaceae bacterium]MCO5323227.1 spermidine/putrescine ABC transporter substrate-binding protein [Nocardioidaceae bacterium]